MRGFPAPPPPTPPAVNWARQGLGHTRGPKRTAGSPGKKTRETGCAPPSQTEARIDSKLTRSTPLNSFFFFFK